MTKHLSRNAFEASINATKTLPPPRKFDQLSKAEKDRIASILGLPRGKIP